MRKFKGTPGPGRPKGRRNNRTLKLGRQLDRIVPDEKLIRLLLELAQGQRHRVLGKDGKLHWVKDRGDGHVATWLGDRKWGKVPTAVSGDPGGASVSVRVISDDRLGVKP